MESFETLAQEEGLTVFPSGPLGKNDQRILGLGDARRLIQWLYRDASIGDVSEDEEINENYVIAVMESQTPAGITPFEQVRGDIMLELSKDKKAAVIKQKLGDATGSLDEIAAAYGPDAAIYQTPDLRMDANILPNVGFDPAAVGMAFHLGSGQTSKPFAGESGVLILEVQNVTESPEIADYTAYKQGLLRTQQLRTSQNISDAIKEDADIVDERYKFY
jgi:peptidyl-prolyl cis-trans isomerase D